MKHSDKKLQKLNKKLNNALMAAAKLEDAANAGKVHHQLKPLAFEVTKQAVQHPAVELLNNSISQFKEQHGTDPVSIRIPPPILKQILDLLPDEDQKLFWVAPVKKLGGLVVDLSDDGTLVLQ